MSKIKLRDYQERGVSDIRLAFRYNNVVVFVMPTGSGKTITFCFICDAAGLRGRRVMIIVHRKELLKQASKALTRMGIEHGLIAPWATPNPRAMIQVASVDALASKKGQRLLETGVIRADLLVFDEGHHVLEENKWGRSWVAMGKPKTLLVTATPKRTDRKGLGKGHGGIADTMVVGPSKKELIGRGSLVPLEVYGCTEPPDVEGVKHNSEGEYDAQELASRVDKPHIIGNAVKEYTAVCPGARAVAFCANIKHAINVRDAFNTAGYKFELLVGDKDLVSDAQRTKVIRDLESGAIDGICSVDLAIEGLDVPPLICCIMLRPTESLIVFLQQCGRVERPFDGKEFGWLLDHAGNVGRWTDGEFKLKHGLPDQDREWSLEAPKKKSRKKGADEVPVLEMNQCKKCSRIFDFTLSVCPHCNTPVPEKAAGGRSGLAEVEGRLGLITPEMAERANREARIAQGMASTVTDMVNTLGYSKGRAEKIVAARAEKQALVEGLLSDLEAWRDATGQTVLETFGKPIAAIKSMKPRELRDLRKRVDDTMAIWKAVGTPAPQQEAIEF